MIVVSYGGGTNSTAMLVGLYERGEKPDLILFADTGGEKPHTYEHIETMQAWLRAAGWSPIIKVRHKDGLTLEQDCLNRKALPSIAYGFKSCSDHFKMRPQRRWLIDNGVVVKSMLVGFDADEPHRAERGKAIKDPWEKRYPLIEWGWGRAECVEAIEAAGLPLPGKSACFFCPSSKKAEIKVLRRMYPDLAARAVTMEKNATEGDWIACGTCDGSGLVTEKVTGTIEDGEDGLEEVITKLDAPEQCGACHGSGKVLRGVKGLGRSFAWGDLYEAEDRQSDLFTESPVEIDCGCYDGDPA